MVWTVSLLPALGLFEEVLEVQPGGPHGVRGQQLQRHQPQGRSGLRKSPILQQQLGVLALFLRDGEVKCSASLGPLCG